MGGKKRGRGAPLNIQIAGVDVQLHPDRAIYWPHRKTLFVADVHWGKRETLVVGGIPLPEGLLDAELRRLDALVERTGAHRIVVLGDLIHSRSGLTEPVVNRIAQWRCIGPDMVLIRGNHDRHVCRLPPSWRIEEQGDTVENPFVFTHEPRDDAAGYVLAGHVHPAVWLRARGDRLRLPCFHLGQRCAVLPAFSQFTGGVCIKRRLGDRVVAVAGGDLIDLSA